MKGGAMTSIDDQLDQLMQEQIAAGQMVPVFNSLLQCLGPEAALVLCSLAARSGVVQLVDNGTADGQLQVDPSKDAWFPMPAEEMERQTGLTYKQQRRLFDKLTNGSWIKTKQMGNRPCVRHIRINFRKFAKAANAEELKVLL